MQKRDTHNERGNGPEKSRFSILPYTTLVLNKFTEFTCIGVKGKVRNLSLPKRLLPDRPKIPPIHVLGPTIALATKYKILELKWCIRYQWK